MLPFGWNGNRNMMLRFTRGSIFNSIKDRCMVFNLKATTIYQLFPCLKTKTYARWAKSWPNLLKQPILALVCYSE